MATGLFFGTFNPVHRGHEALAVSWLNSGYIQRLEVVLTPDPPHKQDLHIASFSHRFNMLNYVFGAGNNIAINCVEQSLPAPHYTLHTIRHIVQQDSRQMYYLCVGSDTLQTIDSWYRYREIGELVTLLVAGRPDHSLLIPDSLDGFRVVTCPHEPIRVSSTDIRASFRAGTPPGSAWLHEGVQRYIEQTGLYAGPDEPLER